MYHDFGDKDANEQVPITFDFSPLLGTSVHIVALLTLTVEVKHGDDPYPQGFLSGAANVDNVGNTVTMLAVGGVPGCHYTLTAMVSTDNPGEQPVCAGTIRCRKAY